MKKHSMNYYYVVGTCLLPHNCIFRCNEIAILIYSANI